MKQQIEKPYKKLSSEDRKKAVLIANFRKKAAGNDSEVLQEKRRKWISKIYNPK